MATSKSFLCHASFTAVLLSLMALYFYNPLVSWPEIPRSSFVINSSLTDTSTNDSQSSSSSSRDHSPTLTRISSFNMSSIEPTKSKIILMWSTASPIVQPNGTLAFSQCPIKSCLFTSDVSLLEESDVVIFYMDLMTDLPLNRRPHQRFVFFHLESPFNTNLQKINDPRFRYNYFNWTMTYRWDSDIVQREHYGYVMPKSPGNDSMTRVRPRVLQDWSNSHIKSTSTTNNTSLVEQGELINLIRNKTKMVAWFVGHCKTPIRREEYARQLGQYVDVDIFGKCNKKDCPINCDQMLSNDYKFYLSFENSWCPDYVSEKFYRPLVHDAVPIAMGGANYNLFAPPGSFINARDYSSPKELADYLLMLNRTDELYAKYFDWKKDFEILTVDNYGICDLCRMAHDETLPSKVYSDIKEWWMGPSTRGQCEKDSLKYF